jgi:type II secretory ATPase GspE/PulE/Tfp pilus assembly ATPase PilB-like protein
VIASLPARGAAEAVARVAEMGVDPFWLGDCLVGVLAQRLVRRLCGGCRQAYEPSREEVAHLEALCGADAQRSRPGARPAPRLYRSTGCRACSGTGYRGRMAVHELLIVDDPLRRTLGRRGSVEELRAAARAAGMTTLAHDGVDKCLQGHTDLPQVLALAAP